MTITDASIEVPPIVVDDFDSEFGNQSIFARYRSNRIAVAALILLAILLTCAVLGRFIMPYDPNEQDLSNALRGPSRRHLAGTDAYGRDVLSRLIAGAAVSMKAAVQATSIGLAIGVPMGMFAGFVGGFIDTILSRMNDGLMAVPGIIFALSVVAALGPSLTNAMLAIGILFIPLFFRVARAATVGVREETYIEACQAIGCTRSRTIWRHIFPNVLSPIVVQVALLAGVAIGAEASLSFLGIGVAPPQASWGAMVQSAIADMEREPFLVVFPGICITMTVMALTFVGDGLRDALGTRRIGARSSAA